MLLPRKNVQVIKMGREKRKRVKRKSENIFSEFIPNAKKNFIVPRYHKPVLPDQLNEDQRRAFDTVERHLLTKDYPIRAIIMGAAGAGKSFCISAFRTMFESRHIGYKIAAYTGIKRFT